MRRSRLDVICSFLTALRDGPLKPTPLMYKTNLHHELFMKYVKELLAAGLIEEVSKGGAKAYALTDQGITYLQEYEKFLRFSATFGI